ncbi:alpha/beta fold hydrolase [Pseudoalteromonas sp. APC 3224]|uniref:thioesterase II family protein n=1 Tax=Pseudoalteromonas sp. APC 3224 TaxID=3035203 RepID=UPI0025B57FDD|nr:alpha/beta fold hydrolase [Pseudoalteromonas sp. APC 3224]MDN3487082.1 alpha/beta fold hydrolase [Pseudoalteromonas sp. APC 3224]
MLDSIWFTKFQPKLAPQLRLICFPYAGGSASTFYSWASKLPACVELVAIQLPGRGNRFNESPYSNMDDLIQSLLVDFKSIMDKPYILFGHSLGSRVAFELMNQIKQEDLRLPIHFVASGSKGPNCHPRKEPIHHLPAKEFIHELSNLNGTPKEVLKNKEIMELYLPTLRADFQMAHEYIYKCDDVFNCPISVLGGEQDIDITLSDLESWGKHFQAPYNVHILPGDHFFVDSHSEQVLKQINRIIQDLLNSRSC